jgi:hypothetical protein
MKNMMIKLLGVAVIAASFSACSGGGGTTTVVTTGGGSSGGGTVVIDPYYHAWYNVYGTYCRNGYPESGCNFYADGTKITASGDPYHNSMTLNYDYWTYTDSYGYGRSYTGYAWLSTTGILYDNYGNALNELDSDSTSNDVISAAAAQESQINKAVGKAFAQQNALSEDKGIQISQTLQDWAVLGRDRARTTADINDMSKRLYGLDANRTMGAFQRALTTQSQQPLEELNVDVAAHWGTSPETSKQILKGWYKDEVAAYGIQ